MWSWLGSLGGIILVDLVLSGDNALVIGAAASKLPRRQRWLAILFGGGGAIVLRIAFAIIATLLLQLPLLKAIGGALLMVIAVRLLMDRNTVNDVEGEQQEQTGGTAGKKRGFLPALMTILVADVTMSLDNVLAVGALAAGDLLVLAAGLVVSILFLLVGSALISELISRLPLLLDLASLVLGWTAAHMILDDINLGPMLDRFPWTDYALPAAAIALILAADFYLRWRVHHKQKPGQV